MKYVLNDVCIEVTRRCNMGCAHCLRGDAQNIDIDTNYIDALLKDVESIGSITFTGGEPSLNIQAIDYTLNKCQEMGIPVGMFYIVTNGKTNVLPLCLASLKWYAYCDEKEMCGLALSKDMFHSSIPTDSEELLRGLAFFREDKFTDFNKVRLISEGRAEDLGGHMMTDVDFHCSEWTFDEYGESIVVDGMVYLSANGEIRNNCDTSYTNDEYTVGDLKRESLEYMIQVQSLGDTLPF